MFTGIIRHVGTVRAVRRWADGMTLTIDLGPLAGRVRLGDSLAVSGACLTLTSLAGAAGRFDVTAETLRRTILAHVGAGDKANLEPSLRVGDGLDGHLVQGHVDGVGRVSAVRAAPGAVMEFTAARELTDQMVPKGSVAVDGVSLTVVDVADGRFSVALIPTTLAETTLGDRRAGDEVNLETDLIGKYVRRALAGRSGAGGASALTMDKLRDAGFV